MKQYNTGKWKESLGADSQYLKASDCADGGRKIRPLMWVMEGEETPFHLLLEGWAAPQKRGDKAKCVRIPIDANPEDYSDIQWNMASYKGGPERPQTPKGVFALLLWDYMDHMVKCAAFSQTSINKTFNSFITPGEANYLDSGIHTCDFTITQIDEKNYQVQVVPKCKDEPPQEALDALQNFHFSWEAYMDGKNPFDEKNPEAATIAEIEYYNQFYGNDRKPVPQQKTQTKPVAQQSGFKYDPKWKEVSTPKGLKLGDLDIDKLKELRDTLIKLDKMNSGSLGAQILSGIQDLEAQAGAANLDEAAEIPF